MAKLESASLYSDYLNFIAIRNSLAYVQKETYRRNDDKFLKAIDFPYLGEMSKDKTKFVETKMDTMLQSLEELIIIGLVSKFEKIIFDRIGNASGEISKIVKDKYTSKPFFNFSENFVKTSKDINKLSIVKAIIDPKLKQSNPKLSEKFAEVVELRNMLAHGKRFGEQSSMSFDEIAQILDDVLNYV